MAMRSAGQDVPTPGSTLVVRAAEENRDCGYHRTHGAMFNLGHELARSTIAEILKL